MTLWLIHNGDGDTMFREVTEDEVKQELAEGHEFFTVPPGDMDTNYWADKALLIRGELVFPKPKEVVKDWSL